ncbi:MAG: flippase-like domain-containing protein [Desulfobacteraceae bacterium]|nr:flippase-like domain-containing protein [Desulfobacteraceae bacterium]
MAWVRDSTIMSRGVIPFFVSIVLLLGLVYLAGLDGISNSLANVDFALLLTGYFMFVMSSIFRTLRFRIASQERALPFHSHHLVTSAYTAIAGFMPGAIGEFSYPFLLRKMHNMDFSAGVGNVILIRIYDIVTMVGLVLVAIMVTLDKESYSLVGLGILASAGLLLLLTIFKLKLVLSWLNFLFEKVASAFSPSSRESLTKVVVKIKTVITITSIPRQRALLFFYTAVVWITGVIGIQQLLKSLGCDLGFFAVTIVAFSGILLSIVPLTIAGLGLREAAYAGAMVVVGVEPANVVATAIALRLLSLPVNFLIIGLAYIFHFMVKVAK